MVYLTVCYRVFPIYIMYIRLTMGILVSMYLLRFASTLSKFCKKLGSSLSRAYSTRLSDQRTGASKQKVVESVTNKI